MSVRLLRSLCAAAALTLAACGGDDPYREIELNIAHVNDHHSQLDAFANFELGLGGVRTRVDVGGFARLTALFAQESASKRNVLKLHAGDAITGTLYYTFFKGAADAELMNAVCFDAFVLGNHEFDDGDAALKGFLDRLATPACNTPVLSANLAPALGSPLLPATGRGAVLPYTVREFDGVRVGIVGITIKGKTVNSSRPLASTQFLDELPAAQAAIDELRRHGIRHIVLLTHQGYEADKAMAAQLTDVDVVIGGDSHSLLGDFSAHGLASSGPYPTLATNRDGETVCIGQAWEYAKVFATMNVKFDGRGAVSSCAGQAALVLGSNFQRANAAGSFVALGDAERAALTQQLAGVPTVRVTAPDAAAAARLASYGGQVAAERARPIGVAAEALCLVRVPGETTNRSAGVAGCEAAHTLARGSDAAQVVAEAFLHASRRAQFALQNAGGVRVPIAAGTLTMNAAFTLLPFTNTLVELEITGAEVVAALEDGVANWRDNAQSDGSQPYAAGLRWQLDLSQARGNRFSNVQVKDRMTGQWSPIDPARRYVMVTNDFIAEGRDGYATLGTVSRSGRSVNTFLLYTQSFVDHVLARGTLVRPAAGDYSHQLVINRAGTRLP